MSTKEYNFSSVTLGETWPPFENNDGGFALLWEAPEWGFGELNFVKKAGKVTCYTECMGEEFVEAALRAFLKGLEYNHS